MSKPEYVRRMRTGTEEYKSGKGKWCIVRFTPKAIKMSISPHGWV